ncbi:DUF2332 domain-containing protein [Paraurantiacibacter namhicola]|uniref:DUF2332 domain-containing protein n=1 Tax=Paraurantiacibacter namhicola TaxID=645517 RepID=A0A1C7D7M9_9SPHN|nr:DUF2332 domain-containing protein [Paraurantiacibacter namhicola]ANU07455.1 hypothetical protein A6F65_01148 [Paraurantiacibacter namhicola]
MAGKSAGSGVMDMVDLGQAIDWQANHAEEAGAPITARIVRAQRAMLELDTAVSRRMNSWAGLSLRDALPLRVAGGLHWLHLSGTAPALEPVYLGMASDQGTVDRLVAQAAQDFDTVLLPWLDSPPQTNEAGRSASIMAGLLWLADRLGPNFDLFEIGASAGINTMMARYAYDLGGVKAGPSLSRMAIAPEWRGASPPAAAPRIVGVRGCDIAPLDLADPAQALKLKSYVWPDAQARMHRMDAAIAIAAAMPPQLEKADAADFVEQELACPAQAGTTRCLFHSIMWQYLPDSAQARITAAMEAAGAAARADSPLAWLALETNRETFRHELTVRYWPDGGAPVKLAEAHPHGEWVEWLEEPAEA